MMFPSNVNVGSKASPDRIFLAQIARKLDSQPLRQCLNWANTWPCYAIVPASLKQHPFEEFSFFRVNSVHAPPQLACGLLDLAPN